MVSRMPYHPGVSGKSLSSLGTNATQSLQGNTPFIGTGANADTDIGGLVQSLC